MMRIDKFSGASIACAGEFYCYLTYFFTISFDVLSIPIPFTFTR